MCFTKALFIQWRNYTKIYFAVTKASFTVFSGNYIGIPLVRVSWRGTPQEWLCRGHCVMVWTTRYFLFYCDFRLTLGSAYSNYHQQDHYDNGEGGSDQHAEYWGEGQVSVRSWNNANIFCKQNAKMFSDLCIKIQKKR